MGTFALPRLQNVRESQESLAAALTKAESVQTVHILGAEGAERKGANGLRQQTSFSLPYTPMLVRQSAQGSLDQGRRTPQATQMTTFIIRKVMRACGSHCEKDENPDQ